MARNHLEAHGMPCLTQKAYNATYPAISPLRPEVSLHGKTAIVTGAGTAIGRESARAFAQAGATTIFLIGGRREALLAETAEAIKKEFGNAVTVDYATADMTDTATIRNILDGRVQQWDVLLLNAGYLATPATIVDADLDNWGRCWDVGVKGNLQMIQSLLPKRRPGAAILAASSAIINLPPEWAARIAPYAATKTAIAKFFEAFAVKVPDVQWVSFHPGSGEQGTIGDKVSLA